MSFFSITGPSWLRIKELQAHRSALHRNIPVPKSSLRSVIGMTAYLKGTNFRGRSQEKEELTFCLF